MKERRAYFRINDLIGLTYSTPGDDEALTTGSVGEMGVPLADLLTEIDSKFSQAVNILWQENPTVAEALGALNKKISLIAANSLQGNDQTLEFYEELMVSISGCGLAFYCAEQLQPGTMLRVAVVLKPSNIQLKLTARVVACETSGDNADRPYWVRISFDDNNPSAREQLIQHVVQKHYAQLGRENASE